MFLIQTIARKLASTLPDARTARHVLAFLCLLSTSLWGQSTQTLVGTVKDAAGGAVAGATVKVRHLQTGASREALTHSSGDYEIISLQVLGRFEVRAEFEGFKAAVVPEVTVLTGQTVRVDLQLEVGAVTESITVEAEVPLVRSEVSSLGTVVQNREVIELPLYGRDFPSIGNAFSRRLFTGARGRRLSGGQPGDRRFARARQRFSHRRHAGHGQPQCRHHLAATARRD
jgi:hypothetical protein